MKVSGKDCSFWQRAQRWETCSQRSKCTAELWAGCHKPPWREKTALRNVSDPSPSTACKTTWGRQMSASWRMWCSMPEENKSQKIQNKCHTVDERRMKDNCLWPEPWGVSNQCSVHLFKEAQHGLWHNYTTHKYTIIICTCLGFLLASLEVCNTHTNIDDLYMDWKTKCHETKSYCVCLSYTI